MLLLYESLILGSIDGDYTRRFSLSLIELPIKLLATYFTLYVLIDRLLVRKRYRQFLVALVASMIVVGLGYRCMSYFIIYPRCAPEALNLPFFFIPKILIAIFVISSVAAIPAVFHLMRYSYRHQQAVQTLRQATQQLETEKLEAELKLLKSQIHPHFLFNTLNNLYYLTLSQSPKAPEIVHKLSELMSYMLHESNQAQVPLQKEIQYIDHYITLEKMRYGDDLHVSFDVFDAIDNVMIAPLLILPFVENCFKHGISNQLGQGWIRITISFTHDTLIIKVENSKDHSKNGAQLSNTSGHGLKNVQKRLALTYPDQHNLQLFDEKDTFLAVLKINLTPKISYSSTLV